MVFVDIETDYFCIDTSKIEEKITSKTKAIIPVHLYGQPAEMEKITGLCRKYDLYLIEDCAQAHFAEYRQQKAGTFGIAGTFSFYPGKNLGAYGDAGCIITNNDELAKKARMIANHGSLKKHEHEIEGINSRMDGIQAAILSVKLKYISEWNKKRLEHAAYYTSILKDNAEIIVPEIRNDSEHVFHLYVIKTPKRNELQKYLSGKGIETAVQYPKALPFLKAYEHLKHSPEDFPNACSLPERILSLPMFPELTEKEIDYVCENISDFFN